MSDGPGEPAIGMPASFVIVPCELLVDPSALVEPVAVDVGGVRQP